MIAAATFLAGALAGAAITFLILAGWAIVAGAEDPPGGDW